MKSFKDIIKDGGVVVLRTDTLYGLVCDATDQHAVNRIYTIKKRDLLKPVIVLVANIDQIRTFGIEINKNLEKQLDIYWPGKVSIVLPVNDAKVNTHYIHKGTGGIAFRIPDEESLRALLLDVGPLVAPSANPEGQPPASNIQEALDYFGESVDYYVDGGQVINAEPSKIIKISNSIQVDVIRN
jgi:L-threonylcarbamoyladenylate synthase